MPKKSYSRYSFKFAMHERTSQRFIEILTCNNKLYAFFCIQKFSLLSQDGNHISISGLEIWL